MNARGWAIVAALAVASAGAGCSKQGTYGGAPSDELRIALPIDPTQLNPILANNTNESFLDGLIFDELVTQNERHDDVPDLAAVVPTVANGGISRDGLTIVYHLRHGVTWHDGAPFTSRDVKFTWQAIMNPNNDVTGRRGYDQIASIDTPDDYTVVMHMKRFFAPAIDTIFGESDSPYRVLPEHLLAKYPNLNQIPFNAAPVGTGPYKFARWLRGDRILLTANPNYFRGAPKIAHLTVEIVTDANTTQSLLRSHEVDLAIELTGPTYRDLAGTPDLTRQLVVAPVYNDVIFNLARPPLDDVRVRRALVEGMDRAGFVRQVTYGVGRLAVADLSPYYWAYDASLQPVPYDVRDAGALLDAAGWRMGADGYRAKAGKRLALQIVYGQGSDIARTVTVQLQQMYRAIGVDLELKSYPYSMLYASAAAGGIYLGGKFDLGFYSWVSGSDPDNSAQWTCAARAPLGNKVTHYCSAEMDAAQTAALSTFDRAQRKRAYSRIEALLLRDVPAAFMYYRPLAYAHIPSLAGFTPNGISEGWNAQEWSR